MKLILILPLVALVLFGCKKEKIQTNDLTVHVTYGESYSKRTNLKGVKVYLFKGIDFEIEDYKYSGNGLIKNTKTGDVSSVHKTVETDYFGDALFEDLDGVVYGFVADISALSKNYPDIESFVKKSTYLTSIGENKSELYFSTWPYSDFPF